jgi:hypothetical protein
MSLASDGAGRVRSLSGLVTVREDNGLLTGRERLEGH